MSVLRQIARVVLPAGLLCCQSPLFAGPKTTTAKSVAPVKRTEFPVAAPVAIRDVPYNDRTVVDIRTAVRFTTILVLPKGEKIVEFICGDKDFWVINGNENIAEIKPAKLGARTDLNLITASGNIYSFLLLETSEGGLAPDLKVFISLQNAAMANARNIPPVFVSTVELDRLRADLARVEADNASVTERMKQLTALQSRSCMGNVRFGYRFDAGTKPFFVRSICHDDHFTYILARPEETPTVFELKNGKPNLVNFTYQDGIYQINKIVGRGYLAIGKEKMRFLSEE